MNYIVYDNEGAILRVGAVPNEDFAKQILNSDENIMEGVADDITQKVVNGEIVNKSPGEIPPVVKVEKTAANRRAVITEKGWDDLLGRVAYLEQR